MTICPPNNAPCLLDSPDYGNPIYGELYQVDDQMLATLDWLEQHPSYYTREVIEVNLEQSSETNDANENHMDKLSLGPTVKCEVYLVKNFKKSLLKLPLISDYNNVIAIAQSKAFIMDLAGKMTPTDIKTVKE